MENVEKAKREVEDLREEQKIMEKIIQEKQTHKLIPSSDIRDNRLEKRLKR